jgi:hypothetical protein
MDVTFLIAIPSLTLKKLDEDIVILQQGQRLSSFCAKNRITKITLLSRRLLLFMRHLFLFFPIFHTKVAAK